MIGKKTEKVLQRAVHYAIQKKHEYFTLEHVLWSLLDDIRIKKILKTLQIQRDWIKQELRTHLQQEIPKSIPQKWFSENKTQDCAPEYPVATPTIQKLIQRALYHVESSGKPRIQPEHLLIAFFQAKNSKALHLLMAQGLTRTKLLKLIQKIEQQKKQASLAHATVKKPDHLDLVGTSSLEHPPDQNLAHSDSEAFFNQCLVSLNDLAQQGVLDPLIGRSVELERMLHILCRRKKNNPLLIGEPGVGKTALAEGLAFKILRGEVPDRLKKGVVYSLNLGSLLAGSKFRGDFELRFKKMMDWMKSKLDEGEIPILFIDEIHTLIGAGAVSGGNLDAAELLKPILTRGMIRCIGSTTIREHLNIFEKDPALSRRFQCLEIQEPTASQCLAICSGTLPHLEGFHQVKYSPEAVQAAIELSGRYIHDRMLPDKALDVLDEVGARFHSSQTGEKGKMIEPKDIEEVVATMARVPTHSVSLDQKQELLTLRTRLQEKVFGQDLAIDTVLQTITLAKAGLKTTNQPIGSFLFCGPTGVGKTKLSKQIAETLGIPLLRFDMSEYTEKHTVSKLLGAPPGYVGFDQTSHLAYQILKNPYSVILLDEIEKAHPEICNILLQIFDDGVLTDSHGRKLNFRNTLFILTSNIGSREAEKNPLGFNKETSHQNSRKTLEQTFSPEFRNRLNSIIFFEPLRPAHILEVLNQELEELKSQLKVRQVRLEVSPEVKSLLAQQGFNPLMGARPLKRLVEEKIKKPLADQLLFGGLQTGGTAKVLIYQDAIVVETEEQTAEFGLTTDLKSRKEEQPQAL